MKKLRLMLFLIFTVSFTYAQKKQSSARIMIEKADRTRINKDWSLIAEFKSGIGETVQFYPVQIVDLKTGEKTNALQLDMTIKTSLGLPFAGRIKTNVSAWVGLDEIDEFINFIETNIMPNLNVKYRDKSSEFIFRAKEITLSYLIDERRRRLTITLNDYEQSSTQAQSPFYEFWTEARVDNFPDLLDILKRVKTKELKF